jgi:O-antigen ligase
MRVAIRTAVIPAYILLCIVLGGSTQGYWGAATLQLLAIGLIGWSLLTPDRLPLSGPAKGLFAIAALIALLPILQLIPLPPGVWSSIPGRKVVVEGYQLLGQPLPWLPISVTPYETMQTIVTLLPPLAVLTGMLIGGAYRASWIVIAVLLGTFAAVLLGALQVSSGDPVTSPWYFYSRTNHGVATGFFANSNHMASLLVLSIPMLFAMVSELRKRSKNASSLSAMMLMAIGALLVLLVGIFLTGSLAVLLLALPVVLISATLLMPETIRLRVPLIAIAAISTAALGVVFMSPINDKLMSSNQTSFASRQTIWSDSIPAIGDQILLGSGVGSFPRVYRQYEDPAAVDRTFVNHAHNDYIEIVMETGIPGILLLAAFFFWWARRAVPIWRSAALDRYAVAASIASGALLIHSLVDYPLRTAAISSIMAACLAKMARPRAQEDSETPDLWANTRHAAI